MIWNQIYYPTGGGSKTADSLNVGDSIWCNVNNVRTEFIIVQKGNPDSNMYDSSCDGVWLLMKDCYMNYAWSNEYNKYAESNVNTWLNDTFIGLLDSNVQKLIKRIKIPYCVGYWSSTINSGANGLSCKAFLVSAYELGLVSSDFSNILPADGVKLAYFESGTGTSAQNKRIAKLYNRADFWWLRSPMTNDRTSVGHINSTGGISGASANNQYAVRPCFIIPNNTQIDSDNNIIVPDQLTIDALSIGDSVYANVNGTRTEFLIVHNGNPDSSLYDSSCDGVWCLMKDCYTERQWDSSDNAYIESSINSWLQNTFYGYFDSSVKYLIKDAKIPYGNGRGSSGVNTWPTGDSCHVFLLAACELGLVWSDSSNFVKDGAKLDYFESGEGGSAADKRIANYNSSPDAWWERSPYPSNTIDVNFTSPSGYADTAHASMSYGVRPAFILPHTAKIDSNNNIVG